jgi:hypothetical protein
MVKNVIAGCAVTLVMCSGSTVIESTNLTIYTSGILSPSGSAAYLFKQNVVHREIRNVSLGIFDTYQDSNYVESSSIVEFDRTGKQVGEYVINDHLPRLESYSYNDSCLLLRDDFFNAHNYFVVRATDGVVLSRLARDSLYSVLLAPDSKSLIFQESSNGFSQYRFSDGQTTPHTGLQQFVTGLGGYSSFARRISNDGTIAFWDSFRRICGFYQPATSRSMSFSFDGNLETVVNCAPDRWYIGGDSSGIYSVNQNGLQRTAALQNIDWLICTDTAATTGLFKIDSAAEHASGEALPVFYIVDMAHPDTRVEIGRSAAVTSD